MPKSHHTVKALGGSGKYLIFLEYQNDSFMSYEKKFMALKDLPPMPTVPKGVNLLLSKKTGKILTLSGYGPFRGANIPKQFKGKLGAGVTVKQGYDASRLTAMNLLMIVRGAVKSLDKVSEILAVEGTVHCTDGFTQQPDVINGCSDLLIEIFGKKGMHTRSALGTNSMAFAICVEISLTVKLK